VSIKLEEGVLIESRSFTEFILSSAEGFRITTPSEHYFERSEESVLSVP
jgi:hypothetical protein